MPRCIRCNSKKVAKLIDGTYRCGLCNCWFDDDPDEGGDYSNNPVRSLSFKEERERAQGYLKPRRKRK